MIIPDYTREAGLRNLERRIADDLPQGGAQGRRGLATRKRRRSTTKRAREWLGPRRFSGEVAERTVRPGRRHRPGLDPAGGEILFIEATAYPARAG